MESAPHSRALYSGAGRRRHIWGCIVTAVQTSLVVVWVSRRDSTRVEGVRLTRAACLTIIYLAGRCCTCCRSGRTMSSARQLMFWWHLAHPGSLPAQVVSCQACHSTAVTVNKCTSCYKCVFSYPSIHPSIHPSITVNIT